MTWDPAGGDRFLVAHVVRPARPRIVLYLLAWDPGEGRATWTARHRAQWFLKSEADRAAREINRAGGYDQLRVVPYTDARSARSPRATLADDTHRQPWRSA